MRKIEKIKANYDGRIVDAVLLAVYTRECYKSEKTFFERIFFKKTNSKLTISEQNKYLVFIPWKHREKQLVELSEADILHLEPVFPSEWIFIPEFISKGTEEYLPTLSVRNFNGYPFIYQNNSFICNQVCGEFYTNLTFLYAEIPELLNEEFDEYDTIFTETIEESKGAICNMTYLISSHDNSIEPNGAIGKQKCGLIFWQKTGFLRHCNLLGFQSLIRLIEKKFAPDSVQFNGNTTCWIRFDNDEDKLIYLTLQQEKDSKHFFIYGESYTVYSDPDFHILVLQIVSFIAKNIGSKFYVDDATDYLRHKSPDKLKQYYLEYRQSHSGLFECENS